MSIVSQTKRSIAAIVVCVGLLAIYLLFPQLPETVQHVIITVIAVIVVHLLDRVILFADTYEAFEKNTRELEERVIKKTTDLFNETRQKVAQSTENMESHIQRQTQTLRDASASLQTMEERDISRIYSSRSEASADMIKDLNNPENMVIRLIGISLNDFVRTDETDLRQAWREIERLVNGEGRTPISIGQRLDVKVLIIDPNCLGAQLRSYAEAMNQTSMASRLREDVHAVAEALWALQNKALANKDKTGVTFECRLYRLPPIMFLCLTDRAAYVQQYHFWNERDTKMPIPVLRYHTGSDGHYSLHSEMAKHFDFIWADPLASVGLDQYLNQSVVGIDQGMYRTSARNVYWDADQGRSRMGHLLKEATKCVWIQGISLHSFFTRDELLRPLEDLLRKGTVDVRMLLIAPDCYQARVRAYRERLFLEPEMDFATYFKNDQAHHESTLYTETTDTIRHIRSMVKILRHAGIVPDNLRVASYETAPACFMIRIDDSVLVEQYHYGKHLPDNRRNALILGKEMPLIEYGESFPSGFAPNPAERMPFNLMIDHFGFCFRNAKPLELDQASNKANKVPEDTARKLADPRTDVGQMREGKRHND